MRRRHRFAGAKRFVAVALCAVSAWAIAQGAAQPPLPLVRMQAGIHIVRAEVAADPGARSTGLMWREHLEPNHGMLFVFEDKARHCFWMRNTLLPLSIAFLDDDGRIANIENMSPRSDDSHCPAHPVRFALEMEQGWFARHGLAAGAQLVQPKVFPGQRAATR